MAAEEHLRLLFPAPLEVRRSRRRREAEVSRWVAMPTTSNPRLLVGPSERRAAARVIGAQMTGRRPRTVIARSVLAGMARTGLLGLPGRQFWAVYDGGEPRTARRTVYQTVGEVLGVGDGEVRFTFAVGPARSNRKPLIQVTDLMGQPLAFVKVGHTSLTRRLVGREAEALRRVSAELHRVETPTVLGLTEFAGMRMLLLSPLRIPTERSTGTAHRSRLVEIVRDIAAVGGVERVPWSGHPLRERLMVNGAGNADVSSRIRALAGHVPADLAVATGSWHGDLNEGNLAVTADRSVIWDWERFESGVPLGFDLLHHDLHLDITRGRLAPSEAAALLPSQAATVLEPLGIDAETARWVAVLYMVTLAARYSGDDQAAAGGDLGLVDKWLLPAAAQGIEEARP